MYNIWKLTSFGTDNYTDEFLDIKSEDDFNKFLNRTSSDFFVFWGWSNLLLSQNKYNDKLFIRNMLNWIYFLWNDLYRVSAWQNLTAFISYLNNRWISLLNPLFGLPGSIGGAVVGNAGCFWVEIGLFVRKVWYFDEKSQYIESEDMSFAYRDSSLKWKKLFLKEVTLELSNHWNQDIKDGKRYMDWRRQRQEYFKTCWSYFKNYQLTKDWLLCEDISAIIDKLLSYDDVPFKESLLEYKSSLLVGSKFLGLITIPAWWLIDKCWLKWFDYNWVKVSDKHANFFSNYQNKNPTNILWLADIVKYKVYDKFWIRIDEEVVIV